VISFPRVFPLKPCKQLSSLPYVLHVLPISVAQQPRLCIGRPSRSHTLRHTHSVRLLWTSDRLVTEAANYTTHTREEHPCPQRDRNPRHQPPNNRRPTP
jgi:hypothetical protein